MARPAVVLALIAAGGLAAISLWWYGTPAIQRDAQINAYAIPELDKEALAAGSARIDTVSGATYTSEGYVASLRSALDKAGI